MNTTGQAGPDMEAVKKLTDAIEHAARAYGVTPRVSTHWAVAWGVGDVEQYDDEEDARENVRFYKGGSVVKRTVISLPWEAVPAEEVCPVDADVPEQAVDAALAAHIAYQRKARQAVWASPSRGQVRAMLEAARPFLAGDVCPYPGRADQEAALEEAAAEVSL